MRMTIVLGLVMAGGAAAAVPARPEWLWTSPKPEVLKWQAEAQERERARARRMDVEGRRQPTGKKSEATEKK